MPSSSTKRRSRPPPPEPCPIPMSAGYAPPGTKRKLLPWSFAEQRLRRAHNYWVCTTHPDGRPHAAPVWGLWLEGAYYFSTDPSSRKARNLVASPHVVVHVESGDEVVIVEGSAAIIPLTTLLDAKYYRKYHHRLIGFPAPMVVFRVTPRKISAWREQAFPASATQWRFARS